jgi:lysophospholipase L1-like esterase
MLALHIWLKDYCSSAGVTFIDNFDKFWKQKILYRNDGVHPNHLGSWTLSMHFKAALKQ